MTEPAATRPKLWRFTASHPRYTLAIALWMLVAIFVGSAIRSNNPVSLVLCLIPVPLLALVSVAEMHRAIREGTRS